MPLMTPEQIDRLVASIQFGRDCMADKKIEFDRTAEFAPGEQVLPPEARQMLHESGRLLGKAHQALTEIRQWCEAYPTTVFTPLSREQLGEAAIVLGEINIDIGALHAEWARHLLDGIGKIAREALDD